MEQKQFTHLDAAGNPAMVDVAEKAATARKARAQAIVQLPDEVLARLSGDDIVVPKGSVFQTAIIAGLMAAKKTGELIPLCHPLGMDHCRVHIHINSAQEVVVECEAGILAKTGVEMEALTGAAVAALTIYDMCKAFSHDIVIRDIRLMEKSGGKRDFKRQQ